MLEIGFIEERRTTWGNKYVPKPFSTIPLIRKNVLIRLTVYIGNPASCNLVASQKTYCVAVLVA